LFLCDYYNSKFKIKIHWAINLIIAIIALYIASYQEFETKNMWSVLDGVFPHTRQTLSFIGAFLILFVVLNSSFLKKNLSKNIFHYLGNISFSVYLLHLLVLGSISCYLFKFFIETFHWEYFTSFIVMFFISVAIIFTLSHFMYKFIDEKGMKFSAYLYNKFFKHEPRIK
jgi:peptidoglycan/LPS O-acetylase OafA/YrhL